MIKAENLFDKMIKFVAEREALLLEKYIKETVLPKLCPNAIALTHIVTRVTHQPYRKHVFYCSTCGDRIGDCEFTTTFT